MMGLQTKRIICPERMYGFAPTVTGSMDIGTAGHKTERAEKAVIKKTNIYRDDSMKNFFKNITARKVLQICSWGLLLCIGNYVINDVGVSFLSPDIRHILRAAADIVIFVAACCGIRNCVVCFYFYEVQHCCRYADSARGCILPHSHSLESRILFCCPPSPDREKSTAIIGTAIRLSIDHRRSILRIEEKREIHRTFKWRNKSPIAE